MSLKKRLNLLWLDCIALNDVAYGFPKERWFRSRAIDSVPIRAQGIIIVIIYSQYFPDSDWLKEHV